MKYIQTSLKYLTLLALFALAMGCATGVQEKENLATAAGFKVITPTKPDQQAILAKLPAGKVTPVSYKGKSYYVLPDAQHNQAYVGGQTQYQAYQKLRADQQISNDNMMAAQMRVDQVNEMDWDSWGGWGMAGPIGF